MPTPSTPASRKRWRWIAIITATLAVTAAGITMASAATSAVPNVRFTKLYYNSPGTDTRTNASLNAEYVQVTNRGTTTVTLTGWTIRDKSGHTYKLSGTLPAGHSRIVHTGRGTDGRPNGHRYWQSGNYVWNNTGDTATLRTDKGATVHTCTWGRTGSYILCGGSAPAPTKTSVAPSKSASASPSPARTSVPSTPATPPTVSSSPDIPVESSGLSRKRCNSMLVKVSCGLR
ncbi:lamin tail domain-containing protein [Actinoplanes sp. NPDC026670]|uniref:lamin tail domain-containing protein n=1 Tax=Actinoplanes sp. NPDC026670 TaxID=3154700 RepID=UPI0033C56D5E